MDKIKQDYGLEGQLSLFWHHQLLGDFIFYDFNKKM
mgnify:CR=1 FL=1